MAEGPMAALERLQRPTLALLPTIGRAAVGSPATAPRATGGYGLACRGGLILLFLIGRPWRGSRTPASVSAS
ncbi:MAG: hypothetical protein QNM02_02100 [Acidimicrobiia bacterium]|nr:hypothetical protein [Acidimicrobiia bacterium]